MVGNTTWFSSKEPTTVPALDFHQWFVEQHFEKQNLCYLWLKIDIEGAEYTVIPKLLQTRVICSVDRVSVEWHDYKPWMGAEFEKPHMKMLHDNFTDAVERAC